MTHRRFLSWTILLLLSLAFSRSVAARAPLTFEERLKAQEAIERVYYNHRIWPKENHSPKPPFEEMVSREVIEAKVTDYLKKCEALDQYWQRPIRPEQLQAEMDRMARQSKDPAMLRELFAALGNDPVLIAECLAKPNLAGRFARSWGLSNAVPQWRGTCNGNPQIPSASEVEAESHFRVSVPASAVGPFCQSGWRDSSLSDIPEGRLHHTAVWTGSEMIIWGGADQGDLNSGSRYSPATDSWSATSTGDGCPSPRSRHTAIWTGSEMIVWGGGDWEDPVLQSGGRYNPVDDSWVPTATQGACPSARKGHTAVWTGAEMLVWGPSATGGRYAPLTDSWLPIATGENCPTARSSCSSVWSGTEMVVWGGYEQGAYAPLQTGARYNPATDLWVVTSVGVACPSARSNHTAVWTGTEMVIWGGRSGSITLNTGARYDPVTDVWTATSIGVNCPPARSGHTALWTGSEMIVWGGADLQTGGRYNPMGDAWLPTSAGVNCPIARDGHTSVWSGSEMIVWGGFSEDGYSSIGGRYSPQKDDWIPTFSENNVPVGRCDHIAIWTGSEMIVWGGATDPRTKTLTNTGGRYIPATDSWAPTGTSSDCPAARVFHTGLWTGSEVLVWGGYSDWALRVQTNSGARYNPVSDVWVPTSQAVNCPSGRIGHSSIWTGTEMIVWGGVSGPLILKTGGGYNPSSDSWHDLSTGPSCPDVRYGHSAVWTGSEMVIWGGSDGSIPLNKGARYSPLTDSWIPMACGAGCPEARKNHTAVWTGSEMVVWGGSGIYNYLKTGGRYNPWSDTWISTSLGAECPSAREGHTAIWTGKEMAIWGSDSVPITNSGARYDPGVDRWKPMSTGDGCPRARPGFSAVWTGDEMIVWGGGFEGAMLTSGGRYAIPPIHAAAEAIPGTGPAPLEVRFTADGHVENCSELPVYSWDFGDGAVSEEQNPSHSYLSPGIYPWVVTMTLNDLSERRSGTVTATAACILTCTATVTPGSGTAPLDVEFWASADSVGCGGPVVFSWVFGDGSTSSGQTPSHTYASAGTFSWTLTVAADGETCTKTGTITLMPGRPGDCDGDGQVSIGEVQKAINMFLGTLVPACGVDCSGDGVVSIGEVQKAINAFLGVAATC